MKSKTAIYIFKRDNWTETYEVHVSPTDQVMRAHVADVFKKLRIADPRRMEGWERTGGLVHPTNWTQGPFAYCFLVEKRLDGGYVSHEALHIAMAHERFIFRFGMSYGPECGEDEERLAYYLQACVSGIWEILYAHGHVKEY
jgi:hypothetical protein